MMRASRETPLLVDGERVRFEERVCVEPNTGCWLWIGAVLPKGYGTFTPRGMSESFGAHRLSYRIHVGSIPVGLHIDHLCRQPACVNPAHLEAVTSRENTRRGAKAQRTHCIAGHELDGQNLYVRRNGTRCCKACMRRRESERARRVAEPAAEAVADALVGRPVDSHVSRNYRIAGEMRKAVGS